MLATVCAENLLPDKVYDEEYSPISGRPRRALSVQQSREPLSSGIWSGANPLPDTSLHFPARLVHVHRRPVYVARR